MQSGDHDGRAELPETRLRALRAEHPALRLATVLVRLDDAVAVVSAEITLPDGGSAAALGTAPAQNPRAVEQAEARAVARAISALGLEPAEAAAPARAPEPPSMPRMEPAPAPTPEPAEARIEPAEPPEPAAPAPQPAARPGETTPAPPAAADDPPLEDYTWTAFWNWARGLGIATKKTDLEARLGESIEGLSPAQVRVLIRERLGEG